MELNLEGLANSVQKPLNEFSERICSDFGGDIVSINVAGSALTADFVPRKSGINTVLVFKEESLDLLDTISAYGRLLFKHNIDMPLIMTPKHIERSCDVFGVEYLDIQLNHKTILGQSPFSSLIMQKSDVRFQCEREFKANMIRLRQGYVASKMGSVKLVDILAGCASGMMPYLRAALWLCDKERQPLIKPTIDAASKVFDFDGAMLEKIVSWKHKKARPDKVELRDSLEYLYKLIDSLAVWADNCEV